MKLNNLLQSLLIKLQSILINELVGLYVGGSAATNCFDEKTSDIDCYVITKNPLSNDIIQQLKAMHEQLYLSQIPYAKKIEASYIRQPILINFNPQEARPYFNEGNFYLAPYGHNFLIELHVLREKGLIFFGSDTKELVRKITTKDLQLAIRNNLNEYWQPMLANLEKLSRPDYQIFAIFTMCRTLYTLKTNKIASKLDAAHWTIENTQGFWKELIEKALSWQPDHSFNFLKETQKFIAYVLNKVEQSN